MRRQAEAVIPGQIGEAGRVLVVTTLGKRVGGIVVPEDAVDVSVRWSSGVCADPELPEAGGQGWQRRLSINSPPFQGDSASGPEKSFWT
ncbi:hypothetical protein DPMN_091173 [Dreissena polymorpha]|uniref:Uncharacterized protein n=1 Tax=Dreissena polymorpha TaxID=45954 RepID=A0A9D4QZS2_DREPO|nr:hypothetical protein DPMN_091173 [Dreissena polymorpha]